MNENLSELEEQLLSGLQDPDTDRKHQFVWGEEFQKKILGMLLNDSVFLIQSEGLVIPEYFEKDPHQLICRILFNLFRKYKVIPSRGIMEEELNEHIKDKNADTKVYFRGELESVYDNYVPGIETRDYLQDKILDFAKEQAIRIAFLKSLDEFKKPYDSNRWSKIYKLITDATMVDRNFEIGLEYFQSYEERYARVVEAREAGDIFTSGFHSIDQGLSGGGLMRGEIAAWMGISGTGKSLCLTRLAVKNLNIGKKVLYVTLELDEDRTAERFDAQLVDPGQIEGVGINNLYTKKDFVFNSLKEYSSDYEDPRRLIIKQFPSGAMDMSTFRAYYTQVLMHGFHPDLIIIDYVGEMKDYPGMPTWESRTKIVRDLRGFAVENKVFVCVAMQPEKKAKELVRQGLLLDDDNLADAYGQIRPLDCFWTITQTMAEKEAGILRGKACKHRFGKSGYQFYLEMNPNTLIISEISQEDYDKRYKEHKMKKDLKSQEQAAEEIVGRNK